MKTHVLPLLAFVVPPPRRVFSLPADTAPAIFLVDQQFVLVCVQPIASHALAEARHQNRLF